MSIFFPSIVFFFGLFNHIPFKIIFTGFTAFYFCPFLCYLYNRQLQIDVCCESKVFSRCTTIFWLFVFWCFLIVHTEWVSPALFIGGDFCENVEKGGGLEFLGKMRVLHRKIIYKKGEAALFICNVWVLQQKCFLLSKSFIQNFYFSFNSFWYLKLILFWTKSQPGIAYEVLLISKSIPRRFSRFFLNMNKLPFLVSLILFLSRNLLG